MRYADPLAQKEIDRLQEAIARIRSYHRPTAPGGGYDPNCLGCWESGGYDGAETWPCKTIRALMDDEELQRLEES